MMSMMVLRATTAGLARVPSRSFSALFRSCFTPCQTVCIPSFTDEFGARPSRGQFDDPAIGIGSSAGGRGEGAMEGDSWCEEPCAMEREMLEGSTFVLPGVGLLGGGFCSRERTGDEIFRRKFCLNRSIVEGWRKESMNAQIDY